MLRRIAPLLLTLVVVVLGVTALAAEPDDAAHRPEADFVVLVGVPGLRWDDVDPETTPTLWKMAENGAIGALSTRSARRPTCPVDGWLTLGAGNFTAWNTSRPAGACPKVDVTVEQPDTFGANLPEQESVVLHNRERLPWGAVPGALAESVRCTVAVGPGAAVAAARPFGRVDRYAPRLPADPAALLGSCVLSIVDLGTVSGEDRAARDVAVRRIDTALARVLAARPDNSLVLVAGVSDTAQPARLHVAIADGPGWERAWLTSASTGREGYLQLVDLAPTALTTLDRPLPEGNFLGRAAAPVDGRPADLRTAIDAPAGADREAGAQGRVARWFFVLLAGFQVALAVVVLPLLRRARRHAGPVGPAPVPRPVVATVEVLLVAAALAIPAALVADLVPWWRGDHAGWYFAVTTVLLLAAATVLVRLAPGHDRTLGPLGAVAGLTVLVVGADVLTGARLQLNGVVGYSALEGGRYAGLGTVGLGAFVAGVLLAAGWLAQRVGRRWRPPVVVALGTAAVVLVGSPFLGADSVGAIALTAGVTVAAVICSGGWLTLSRLAWASMAGLAVTIGLGVLDLRRPPAERGGLGRFLAALGDGTGGLTVHRASTANFDTLVNSPLTVLAVAGTVLVWFALLQPWGGLMRLFGIYPAMRAAMAGTAVAAVVGGVLGGSALDVAGAAAALVVPMAALASLRVLDHSTDRTQPPGNRPQDFVTGARSGDDPADDPAGDPADDPAGDPVGDPAGDPAGRPGAGPTASDPEAATGIVPAASGDGVAGAGTSPAATGDGVAGAGAPPESPGGTDPVGGRPDRTVDRTARASTGVATA
ncbi:hypothetical protein [Micromonospora cathayae]|uniref:Di-and tricarboxylate transporter n=1 Tax=Micromonospora cathayae TaxID=3028804 RepID=A0ABY7ZHD6_9ACTN|nr:hypothetical protein [Micromonospora sp. HUAS 3]WDZ82399.1 hypothetical protein PVK37_18110 [Micromonospora sp. HUAS 3]